MRDIEIRLADLRKDHNMKQKDLAMVLNVKENTYSKWEKGSNDIPLLKSNELANYFKVSLDFLFGLSDENTKPKRKNIDYDVMRKRMLELRKKRHLSQEKLSNELGFHQKTYSNFENGTSIPTTMKVYYIAYYYNVSIDYLVGKRD